MSNLFDTAINKFLIESYNSDVYQPQERVEDHIKYRSTLAHLGYNHEDEEFVDKNFKQHKGRTMAEAIKDLEEKEDSGEGAAQQGPNTTTHSDGPTARYAPSPGADVAWGGLHRVRWARSKAPMACA